MAHPESNDLDALLRDPRPLAPVPPELVKQVVSAVSGVPTVAGAKGSGDSSGPPRGADPALPERFGKHRVVGPIGRGGMGVVLEAEDADLGRRVAVKVLAPAMAPKPGARERFDREARAAAAVRHENVVEIYEVGEQDGLPYFVMPLLPGESLAARLKGGALLPEEVVRVGREIAAGLAAAHAVGLVHRDIKPANLWLEAPKGRVKVLDFGLARLASGADRHTDTGAVVGTADYMSPEQASGLVINPRSDLFSLGSVLYHAATGVKPFPGETLPAVLRAVADHKPPSPWAVNPMISQELSDLIERLLEKRPEDRPPGAEWVVAALDAIAAGAQAPALPPPP
ncbi:MAG: serine/threonine protein kinase, partial [Planctomycetes bacterium]|nr:serine/threonine protein kinase [Planctomycetota bacterium]